MCWLQIQWSQHEWRFPLSSSPPSWAEITWAMAMMMAVTAMMNRAAANARRMGVARIIQSASGTIRGPAGSLTGGLTPKQLFRYISSRQTHRTRSLRRVLHFPPLKKRLVGPVL